MKQPQVELLAPASGYEAVCAAICAGADAVYTGGTRFGARAYADNLAEEELLQAIDFVHLHGKQLYLTVNTLLKEKELQETLEEYLTPYYIHGLDAVIVQDIGVFRTIRELFPDLPVHVSTQAVVTGKNSAKLWEEMGAQRIVTARELSLEEIKNIRENVSIEIESFVHGALCYCYSGQCLFSSFLGGRSGNRGRCAQPCRLPYEFTDASGNKSGREQYLLSPKDMCTLDILPDIIDAGVFSLKIEGRMKRPEYTAGVTEIYRKYIDLYLSCRDDLIQKGNPTPGPDKIKEQYRVSPEDKERLMDLYNRGNFHSGYYTMHNGTEMMSMERPNHNGVYAGTMKKGKNVYSMKAEINLYCQDILEFRGVPDKQKKSNNLELTLEKDIKKGAVYTMPEKYTFLLGKRQSVLVYRTKKEQLLRELHKNYIEDRKQTSITGRIVVCEGKKLSFMITNGEQSVTVTGDVVETAQNQPAQQEDIYRQIIKTGNTPFCFDELTVELQGNCFVPVKALNQLRRDALEKLEAAITGSYRRSMVTTDSRQTQEKEQKPVSDTGTVPQCRVSVEDRKQLSAVLQFPQVDAVYISVHAFPFLSGDTKERLNTDKESAIQQLIHVKEQCHQAGKKIYLVMPYILRKSVEERLMPYMQDVLKEIDGIVAKNMEVLAFVNLYRPDIDVVLDYSAYTMNSQAVQAWKEAGATMLTLPVELNKGEIKALTENRSLPWEMVIYGHMPMMVSAQCPVKNTIGCRKKTMISRLKDRKGSRHYVKNYCDSCYSVIYNSEPLVLTDLTEELRSIPLSVCRLQFTIENEEEIKQVLDMYIKETEPEMAYTRGHWKRGVE